MIIVKPDCAIAQNEVLRVIVRDQFAKEDGERIHESRKKRSIRTKNESTRWPVHGQGSTTLVLPHFKERETKAR